jgi:hypothetical protein
MRPASRFRDAALPCNRSRSGQRRSDARGDSVPAAPALPVACIRLWFWSPTRHSGTPPGGSYSGPSLHSDHVTWCRIPERDAAPGDPTTTPITVRSGKRSTNAKCPMQFPNSMHMEPTDQGHSPRQMRTIVGRFLFRQRSVGFDMHLLRRAVRALIVRRGNVKARGELSADRQNVF